MFQIIKYLERKKEEKTKWGEYKNVKEKNNRSRTMPSLGAIEWSMKI
jgi:hypothetical protein